MALTTLLLLALTGCTDGSDKDTAATDTGTSTLTTDTTDTTDPTGSTDTTATVDTACDVPAPDPLAFDCGSELTCTAGVEFCYIFSSGVKPKPGDDGVSYSCKPITDGCLDCQTCDCVLSDLGELSIDTGNEKVWCSELESGGLEVSHAGS